MSTEEDPRRADELIETLRKFLSDAYDKAAAYTNLVLLGGYAGFFGLWQLTKDYLGRRHQVLAALLMLSSVAVFVLFEVVKTYLTAQTLRQYGNVMTDPANAGSVQMLQAAIDKVASDERRRAIGIGRAWQVAFFVTLATGLAAVAILAYGFVGVILAP